MIKISNTDQESLPFLKGDELVRTSFFSQNTTASFLQWKIFNALLQMGLEADRKNRGNFFVNFSTIKRMVKFNSNSMNVLHSATQNINEFRFKIGEGESSEYLQPVTITLADYGVNFTLHQKIYDLQDVSKSFIPLDMSCLSKLKSYYACVLYEIILLGVEKGVTSEMLIQDFIELLQLNKSYLDSFKLFNSKVIKPAVSQINSFTDYEVDLLKHKSGKKVLAVSFRVTQKPAYTKYKDADLALAGSRLYAIGFDEDVVDKFLQKYSAMRILGNIDYVLKLNNRKTVENLQGYVLSAIKKNYAQVVDPINDKIIEVKSNQIDKNTDTDFLLGADIAKSIEIIVNKTEMEKQNLLSNFERFLDEFLPFLKQSYVDYQFKSKAVGVAFAIFEKQGLAN